MSGTPERPRRMEPPASEVAAPFWDATKERRLIVQWCRACDQAIFYPREICPGCLGTNIEWRDCAGTGSLHSFTVNHLSPSPTGIEGPFPVALVELDEGFRMLSNVVGCDNDDLRVGMALMVTWDPMSDGRHYPIFEPAGGAA